MQSKEALARIEVITTGDVPLIYAQIKELGIQEVIDSVIKVHNNWVGSSVGKVFSIWCCYLLSEADHRLSVVESWIKTNRSMLIAMSGWEELRVKDFTDDNLEKVLDYISNEEYWRQINVKLGQSSLEVYEVGKLPTIRLDAAPQQGHHEIKSTGLFQYGYSKHHNSNLGMLKVMLAVMDNEVNGFGYPLAHLTVSGEQADDGLYIPIIKECESVWAACKRTSSKLYIGDSKMGSMENRHYIKESKNDYLMPLPKKQLCDKERIRQIKEQTTFKKVYKKDKSDQNQLVAQGFECEETISYERADGQVVKWSERRVYVQSSSYAKSQQKALDKKIETTSKKLHYLLVRKQGKSTPNTKKSLQIAIDEILKESNLVGLLEVEIQENRHQKKVNAYGDKPARIKRWSTFQLHVHPNEKAISAKKELAGWQVYGTTISQKKLSFEKVVWKYREQNRIESRFNDLRNKVIPLLPIFLKKDNRVEALISVLMICLKVCSVIEFKIAKRLKEEQKELANMYAGNPKQSTTRPTAKKILEQFKRIAITYIYEPNTQSPRVMMTDLNPTMLEIIRLIGFKSDIYTDLSRKIEILFSSKNFSEN